jgi:prevent-host-death family protein
MLVGIRDATRQLSSLVNKAAYSGEPVILTSRGKPKAVLLSYETYQHLTQETSYDDVLGRAQQLRERFEAQYGVFPEDLIAQARQEREGEVPVSTQSEDG